MEGSNTLVAFMAAFVVLYFYPAYHAWQKQHPKTKQISILTIFLGWTFVGWVIALIWAVSDSNTNK